MCPCTQTLCVYACFKIKLGASVFNRVRLFVCVCALLCVCAFVCAGDEVVVLEPAFDLYAAQTIMAGMGYPYVACYQSKK